MWRTDLKSMRFFYAFSGVQIMDLTHRLDCPGPGLPDTNLWSQNWIIISWNETKRGTLHHPKEKQCYGHHFITRKSFFMAYISICTKLGSKIILYTRFCWGILGFHKTGCRPSRDTWYGLHKNRMILIFNWKNY